MQLTSIRLIVRGAKASAEVQGVLTAGMVGIPVTIECDDSWNGLSKNLVCRGGLGYEKFKGVSRTFLGVGTSEKVAPEVMIAGEMLYLGIEGYNVDGTLVIPTTWACCGAIQEGVKTEGGPSEDPTLPIWEQLQARIDQFPGTIHDAIEEALKAEEFHPKDGNGIKSAVLNDDYTLTLKFDDGTDYTTPSIRGEAGKDYVLTETDKTEIAGQAVELVDFSEVFQNSDYSKLCFIDVTNGWSGLGKTYEEIQAEHAAGKILVLYHAGHMFNLVSADKGFVFERYYIEDSKLVTDRCTVEEDMIFHVPRVSVLDIAGGDVDLSGYVKSVNGQTPDENGNVEIVISNDSNQIEKEYNVKLSIIGFTRPNGTFSTSSNGRRTGQVSTEGVKKIYINAGFYSTCATIAFYDADNVYLESISVIGSSLTPEGYNYGEGAFELDISGDAYADAAFFVVSSYRDASRPTYEQTFDDDFCKYVKLEGGTEEERPAYRIGKNTMVFFGDSITSGAGGGDYPSLIAEITGATVENRGVGGSTLASGTDATVHICEEVSAYTGSADIICVSGGLNDFNKKVPIGMLSDGYNAELDTTTVIGALESIFRNLLTNHTSSKLYYVITHKAASAELNANALGFTFGDYHDAIVSVLKKYSIPFFDAFANSSLVTSVSGAWSENIRSLYTVNGDGVHPNREGYLKYYVYPIISMMESGV